MPYTPIQHLKYHVWANGRTVEFLRPVADDLFHHELKSSMPTIAKTLLHMMDAEVIWISRFSGGEGMPVFPSKTFEGNKEDLLAAFEASSRKLLAIVEEKGEAFASSVFSYKNLRGQEAEYAVDELIFHIVNHTSFHRGQLVTMLRELGITELLGTDLFLYRMMQKKGEIA